MEKSRSSARFNTDLTEDPVVTAAKNSYGIDYLYPYQRLVIANTLDQVDQIVILPTGAGKSLCFQLAAQFFKGATLVVVPLLSLLHDHVRRLEQIKNTIGVLKGGQKQAERICLYKRIRQDKVKIVFATPEVILLKSVLGSLKRLTITHLVFDEAHCVSEWGERFRPAYLAMSDIVAAFSSSLVTAFTATASATVIERIQDILFKARCPQVVADLPDRPNIYYKTVPVISKTKVLVKACSLEKKPLVVFSRSRTGAEQYARLLRRRLPGREIYFYHAGLNGAERKNIEQWFFDSASGILVSTSAYGMGVDKSDIRTIIHVDVPPSVEAYLQESGRAGRDGKPARALMLYSIQDINFADRIDDDFLRQRFVWLLHNVCLKGICRRKALLKLLGHDADYCAGCDICNKEAVKEPEGERSILAFFKRWNRRFNLRQGIKVLKGEYSYELQQGFRSRFYGFGMLADWEKEDIHEALHNLCEADKIAIPGWGFFKHRIRIRNSHFDK
ncbi:MAG: ATP-dependent DNA helicase RecQ [Spirochaetales bacterium]|nr:ATP-dependent DNA helicase RecQ [Spirochaetales bacterium]